ncbi:hypothetical protein [Mycobacteroides abscessus]|uniref:hypothetical protein n=1 Tax=Mycobacteroides abscessus TaxID=36809 RepID=UPI000C26AEF6|nr:hypothetical protein [Mycobacteroides abscessus]
MGKWIFAVLLGFLGLGLVGDYPLIGFGFLAAGGLLVWMALQGRQAVRVERARPTAARSARAEVQAEVNAAQRAANRDVRQAVEKARRQAQKNLAGAVARVERDQASRWVS